MAEVSIPLVNDHQDDSSYAGEINPTFSFPMSSPSSNVSPRSSAPNTSRSRPIDISISPAPAFVFPPPLTPPPPLQEPNSSSPGGRSSSRPIAGHRRGPSEFIGGDGSKLGPGLMSTSPTKGENALPAPGMSGRRRGHAHRRSAAISQHDLANIVKAPDTSASRRTGSAPSTPCEPNLVFPNRPTLGRARSQPSFSHGNDNSIDNSNPKESLGESPTESSSPSMSTRPRVGFSDKLEFIPRPLSIISSATTSSSISTIRASHSLNGSVTSLKSLGTSSPPSVKRNNSGDDIFGPNLLDYNDESPDRGANARSHISSSTKRPSTPSRASQDNLAILEEESLGVTILDSSSPPRPQLTTDLSRLRGVPESSRPRTSPEPSENKRSGQSKPWSDLISRKSKQDPVTLGQPPQSHSEVVMDTEPDFSLDDINFDDDSTYVVRSPEFDVARSVQSNPSPSVPEFDPDMVDGAVLDLDEVWYRAGMNTKPATTTAINPRQLKRAMHSSGATGGFTGPGLHYHRRAESAPIMAAIDYGLGFPRHGSNPQMAEVFDEEEEDDYNKNSLSRQASRQNKLAAKEKKLDPLTVNVEENETPSLESSPLPVDALSKMTTSTSEPARPLTWSIPSRPSDRSLRNGKDLSIQTLANNHRSSPLLTAPITDGSSPTPTQPSSIRNYASSHGSHPSQSDRVSNFPGSLDASPLQTSFEVPRLGTAHSSATDRSTWSSARAGESAKAMSMDDVPSLVSSSSTMISHIPLTPVVGSRPTQERCHSLTGDYTVRPRTPLQAAKRASLASLSKLMGGSFSEKSKLSIESKAEYDDEEETTKTKKRHRISRLMKMKFWKSKEDFRGSGLSQEGPRTA